MKRTLTEQYGLIKKGKGHKDVFLKEAKKLYPNLIRPGAAFNEASTILKNRGIINENFVGLGAINSPFEKKEKESYETAFSNFLKEAKSLEDIVKDTTLPKSGTLLDLEKEVMKKAKEEGLNPTDNEVADAVEKHADMALGIFESKAVEKKVSKEVEEDLSKNYDQRDEKDPNNMIFGQIQMGYYCELKNPKNADKTEQEIKDIVFKNLAKDPIYYTKNGQFGEEGVGYTDEAPSLGEPKEAKGPHKSSGYSTLKEHSVSTAGGIVTGGGFVNMNYMDYFGLNEAEGDPDDATKVADETERARDAAKEIADLELFQEDDVNEAMVADEAEDAMYEIAEDLYDSLGSVDEVLDYLKKTLPKIETHLGLKFGD